MAPCATYAASNELAAATSAITALAVSPPNATGTTVLVVGDAQGRLRRWDLSVPANPAEISGFIGHRSAVTAVAFDGANTLVASGDDSGNVILWDSEFRDEIAALLPHQGAVTALVVSANGDYLITGGADGSVHVISLVDGQTVTTLEVGAAVTQIAPALGAGELALAVVDADGDVHLYATQGLTLPTPTE
jgi:WD40 repeat protein